ISRTKEQPVSHPASRTKEQPASQPAEQCAEQSTHDGCDERYQPLLPLSRQPIWLHPLQVKNTLIMCLHDLCQPRQPMFSLLSCVGGSFGTSVKHGIGIR